MTGGRLALNGAGGRRRTGWCGWLVAIEGPFDQTGGDWDESLCVACCALHQVGAVLVEAVVQGVLCSAWVDTAKHSPTLTTLVFDHRSNRDCGS